MRCPDAAQYTAGSDRMYKLPAAAWAVAEADGPARRQLATATRAAYQALIEPYWPRIHACLHAEQITRVKILATGGPDRLLASLQGRWIRWRRPVLEVLVPGQAEVHLDGRGIVLLPSLFVGETPFRVGLVGWPWSAGPWPARTTGCGFRIQHGKRR